MLGTARGLQVPEPADRHRGTGAIGDRDRRAAVLRGGPDGSLVEVVGGTASFARVASTIVLNGAFSRGLNSWRRGFGEFEPFLHR